MKSLTTMKNITGGSEGIDTSPYTTPDVPQHLKEYMDYMSTLPDMYKEFSQDNNLLESNLDLKTPSNDFNMMSEEGIQVKRPSTKIDMANPTTQKVIESIDNLNLKQEDRDYLIKLGNRESSLNPLATQGSFSGLYQFNRDSLRTVKIKPWEYKENILKQHEAALRYKAHNLSILEDYKKYIGKQIKGITITENGLAAAAHLLGAGTVKDFFDNTRNSPRARAGFTDALGTNILEYFALFS